MMKEILVLDCEEQGTFWITLKSNHKIHFVTTAHEGLEMLTEKVGLVFLSMKLPDMDSLAVLGQIKRDYPSTAVIMMTSCGTEDICMESFRKGARDYLKKPLISEDILQKINILMSTMDASEGRRHISLSREQNQEKKYPGIPAHLVSGVLRVRDFVSQNYSESLTLDAACKMATTSKTYFCSFFKSITGHSLRSYHQAVKIRMAKELLRDKRLSIADVAMKLGYNDPNYFSTIYKKVTGISPKQQQSHDENSDAKNGMIKAR